jgi:hypothetical protein
MFGVSFKASQDRILSASEGNQTLPFDEFGDLSKTVQDG